MMESKTLEVTSNINNLSKQKVSCENIPYNLEKRESSISMKMTSTLP